MPDTAQNQQAWPQNSRWALQMLSQRGVAVVMPHDGRRKVDFTQGTVYSSTDHLA